jgi:hypothetical protein
LQFEQWKITETEGLNALRADIANKSSEIAGLKEALKNQANARVQLLNAQQRQSYKILRDGYQSALAQATAALTQLQQQLAAGSDAFARNLQINTETAARHADKSRNLRRNQQSLAEQIARKQKTLSARERHLQERQSALVGAQAAFRAGRPGVSSDQCVP